MTLRKFKREQDILTIIRWLWMMPLLSLPELAVVTGLTYNRCNRLAKILYRRGMVESVRLGMTLELQDRWYLTTSGVEFAMQKLGYSLDWQVSEAGLRLLIRRLPTLEVFYRLVHRLWGLHGVERINPIYWSDDPDDEPIEFPPDLRLTRFQWQRDSDIHAITEYANGAWAPWVWVGPMTKMSSIAEKRKRGGERLVEQFGRWQTPTPALWVVIGADHLGAFASQVMWPGDDVLVMTADGTPERSAEPHDFNGACFENAQTDDVGIPERIPAWVQNEPAVNGLIGKLNYALFQFAAQWPGTRVEHLRQRFTASGREIQAALNTLVRDWDAEQKKQKDQDQDADEDRGKNRLIEKRGGHFYLSRLGMLAAARMDRISHQSIYSSYDVYLKADGQYRRSQEKHNQAVADFVLAWRRNGGEAFHGRRWVMPLADGTQIMPDAIAIGSPAGGQVGLYFVEVELSARSPTPVRHKLLPYRTYQQSIGQPVNLLVVVGTEEAEKNFLEEGRGLAIFTTTLDRLLAAGPDDDPWRTPRP